MQHFSEKAKLVKKWKKYYKPFQLENDFEIQEGCIDEVTSCQKDSFVVFTLADREEKFVLLAKSAESFEYERDLVLWRPFCPIQFRVWKQTDTKRDYYFVRSLKVNWSTPVGMKFVLYLSDGTQYTMNVPDNERLTKHMLGTLRDNIEEGRTHEDIGKMLGKG